MSSIELSPAFIQPMISRLFRNTETGIASSSPSALSGLLPAANTGSGQLAGQILLMKGTIPAAPNLGAVSARSSDILVRFRQSLSYDWNGYSNFNTNPVSMTSQYSAAQAGGTATWFWWVVNIANSPPGDDSTGMYQQAIGTVGLVGSGADLEMGSTNIVNGQQYRIANLKINFPSLWTF